MEKLLHERLRESAENGDHWLLCAGEWYGLLTPTTAIKLADEIERDYRPLEEVKYLTPAPLSECVAKYTGVPANDGEKIEDYLDRNYVTREEYDALLTAQNGSAHYTMKLYGETHGMPFEDNQNITKWLYKWFIQRPRFEDGEPVQFGDQVPHNNDSGRWEANRICLTESGFYFNDYYRSIKYDYGESVNRPTKVLDADGVEIKVGHTVYNEEGKEYIVTDYCSSKNCIVASSSDGEGYHLMCYFLTHEKPVFDADGVRIRKGDTVWHANGTWKWKVTEIRNGQIATVSDECQTMTAWRDPQELTHREPDSIEKLRDDLCSKGDWHEMSRDDLGALFMGVCDRLTALIERGA